MAERDADAFPAAANPLAAWRWHHIRQADAWRASCSIRHFCWITRVKHSLMQENASQTITHDRRQYCPVRVHRLQSVRLGFRLWSNTSTCGQPNDLQSSARRPLLGARVSSASSARALVGCGLWVVGGWLWVVGCWMWVVSGCLLSVVCCVLQ